MTHGQSLKVACQPHVRRTKAGCGSHLLLACVWGSSVCCLLHCLQRGGHNLICDLHESQTWSEDSTQFFKGCAIREKIDIPRPILEVECWGNEHSIRVAFVERPFDNLAKRPIKMLRALRGRQRSKDGGGQWECVSIGKSLRRLQPRM